LQGRERPEEFSGELQKTWIFKNTPDLSTPLGHLIFTEEINSNQMWENPAIPRIEVVVPDDVKERMFEDSVESFYLHSPILQAADHIHSIQRKKPMHNKIPNSHYWIHS
jgi:hypothetical protein